ncbi:hypothetical protein MRX96_050016 [Rhipicephalus microplus]
MQHGICRRETLSMGSQRSMRKQPTRTCHYCPYAINFAYDVETDFRLTALAESSTAAGPARSSGPGAPAERVVLAKARLLLPCLNEPVTLLRCAAQPLRRKSWLAYADQPAAQSSTAEESMAANRLDPLDRASMCPGVFASRNALLPF